MCIPTPHGFAGKQSIVHYVYNLHNLGLKMISMTHVLCYNKLKQRNHEMQIKIMRNSFNQIVLGHLAEFEPMQIVTLNDTRVQTIETGSVFDYALALIVTYF